MEQTRRRFIVAGAGLGSTLVAGCLEAPAGEGTGDGRTDGDPSGGECEPIELTLVDEPPHAPERPPIPENIEDEDDWDDHHLGEGMDTATDLSFDRLNVRYLEPPVDQTEFPGESVFLAELFTDRDAFEALVEPTDDESDSRLEEVDFETEAILVVLSGFGSSSVTHEWVRVEEHCEEVHVHGYYVWPYIQTSDYTRRVSGLVIERPEGHDLERAWVSLTVDEDRRVNVDTDEGVRVVDGRDGDGDDGTGGDDTVDRVQVVPATREYAGDWYGEEREDIGIAVHLDDEDELRALVEDHEDVDRFVEGTDFEDDAVFYLESAGPDACHRTIDVRDVEIRDGDDGGDGEDGNVVRGTATVVDERGDEEACAEVVTFPGVLIRVASGVDAREGAFDVVDGWGEAATVESISMAELAQE